MQIEGLWASQISNNDSTKAQRKVAELEVWCCASCIHPKQTGLTWKHTPALWTRPTAATGSTPTCVGLCCVSWERPQEKPSWNENAIVAKHRTVLEWTWRMIRLIHYEPRVHTPSIFILGRSSGASLLVILHPLERGMDHLAWSIPSSGWNWWKPNSKNKQRTSSHIPKFLVTITEALGFSVMSQDATWMDRALPGRANGDCASGAFWIFW